MMATLSRTQRAPKQKASTRSRPRAKSHLPPIQSQGFHNVLKGRTFYDTFPVRYRFIVLNTKLNVKKALQCLLLNGLC